MKVLSIESDAAAASALRTLLADCEFVNVTTGKEGIDRAGSEPHDVILNNFYLPDMPVQDLITALREEAHAETPIVVVGPHRAPEDWEARSVCFDAGADGYQPLPCPSEELISHLRAVVRRSPRYLHTVTHVGALEYDSFAGSFKVSGEPLLLTPNERTMLVELTRHVGVVLSATRLDRARDSDVDSNSCCQLMSRIRQKIAALDSGTLEIETVRGLGYRLQVRR